MATIRVAAVQMAVSPKLDDNLDRIVERIQRTDADFIAFPAMSLTGYHGDFGDKAARNAWRQIAAACRQSYTTALIGTGCREDGETFIQSRIYSVEGKLLGAQEMLVPTAKDRAVFTPGAELRVFDKGGLLFGSLIGNDFWVAPGGGPYPDPRLSYQLAQKGAHLIFLSAATGTDPLYAPYYESNIILRAREAERHIVTVNAASDSGALNCFTGVVTPEGKWAAQCDPEGEQSFVTDIEIDYE